jgi:hypothetical protein
MKTTQAWGWLAAGVLALGLNGFYQDGGAEWAHQIVDRVASRSGAVLALASGRGDQFLSEAGLVTARDESRSCRVATSMARLQTRMARGQAGFARVEAMSAREEAAMARLEGNRARIKAQVERVRFMPAVSALKIQVACPRLRVNIPRIQIPQIEIPRIDIPEVNLAAPPVGMEAGPV